MLRVSAFVLAALALCVSARAGTPEGVRWAGSWQAATAEAAERNVPILVVFVRQDEAGLAIEKSVLTGREFVAASKKWVTVYCNRDETQPTKKEGDKEFSALTPGITVAEHIAAWKALSGQFFKTDDAPAPAFVWCLPSGEEVGRNEGPMTSREVTARMAEATKKAGPGLDAGDYVEALDHLKAGGAAADERKVQDAVKEFAAVVKMQKLPGSKGVVSRAQAELDKLDAAGRAAMEPANEVIVAEDYPRAKTILKDVMDTYRGLPAAKDAGKKYDEVCELEKAKAKRKIGGDGKR